MGVVEALATGGHHPDQPRMVVETAFKSPAATFYIP
jgi:hypothetical protein